MKSVSVKKIAAIGAGAALVGAALAGAVNVDSTGLSAYKFFTNGEPAVKIVVGGKAQPSDAVAAANIAAMIGNLAYTDESVAVDTAGVSCAAGTEAGSCGVDAASKKVTFSVTVPGTSSATSYLMKTFINDNLDVNVDTTRNSTSSYDGSLSTGHAKYVTKDNTDVLKLANEGKISNHKSLDVKQEQKVYLFANTKYDTTDKALISQTMRAAYVLAFTPNPLPICWDTSKNATDASCSESDRLKKTHTKVNFLGEEWVVVDYTLTDASYGPVTSLTLGKETGYNPYMNIDDVLTASNGAKVVLKSVTPFAYTASNLAKASFEVTSAAGVTTTETINDGSEKEVAGVTIKVNNVFPGVNNVNYADVSVYSDKIVLSNTASEIDSDHKWWQSTIGAANYSTSPAIKNISVYSTNRFGQDDSNKKWKAGEYGSIIRGAEAFKFSFEGVETQTYDTLTVAVDSTGANRSLTTNSTSSSASSRVSGKFAIITSGLSGAFTYGSYPSTNTVYMLLVNDGSSDANAAVGTMWIQDTSNTYRDYVYIGTSVQYEYTTGEFATINQSSYSSVGSLIRVSEQTKEYTDSGYTKDIGMLYNNVSLQFVKDSSTNSTPEDFYYNTAACTGSCVRSVPTETVTKGYVTDRGTKLESIDKTTVTIKYPKATVKAQYRLGLVSATGTAAGSVKCSDVAVGGTCNIDTGYVATVDAIAASGTGAAGACVLSGTSDVTASPATAAKVAELNTASAPIVVLDSQAPQTEPLIVVGGPVVNTVAGSIKASADLKSGSDAVVAVEGSKILVAGYTAADTTAAATELIKWLDSNRGAVRG